MPVATATTDFPSIPTPSEVMDDEKDHSHTSKAAMILTSVFASIIVFVFFAFILFCVWRRRRSKTRYNQAHRDDSDDTSTPLSGLPAATAQASQTVEVNRNTSVRSVMTLPPYRPKPLDNESVLGREGERDGIDIVVEMPTVEEDEAMREQEMDTLFQIRQTRRRQVQQREELRQARQNARTRNDRATVQALRTQLHAATASSAEQIEALRVEHNRVKETRQRAVSSVSYADLGVARHDGTRIRANSTESERVGLLSDASSIAARPEGHQRGRSGSSALSIDTMRSDSQQRLSFPPLQTQDSARSRRSSASRAGSSPELIDAADADLGSADIPVHDPPNYEDVALDDNVPPPPTYAPMPVETPNWPLPANGTNVIASDAAIAPDASQRARPNLHISGVPQIVIESSSAEVARATSRGERQ